MLKGKKAKTKLKLPEKKKRKKRENAKLCMQGQTSLPWGEKSTEEEVAQAQGRHVYCRRRQM